MNRLLLALGVLLVSGGASYAGGHHGCCADCGCNTGLRKVCRWECEEEEVKVPCFDCDCEEVVIPGESPFCIQPVCEHCGDCQNGCQGCSPHFGHRHHKKVWGPPSDCCVKSVRVLVRKDKTIKKKVWKPVIETVCDRCCAVAEFAGGPAPPTVGAPMGVSARPQDEAGAPMPPLPTSSETPSTRRGLSALLSAVNPKAKHQ